jgi:hypothetical protein
VQAALAAFPGAEVRALRPLAESAPGPAAGEFLAAVPEDDDEIEDDGRIDTGGALVDTDDPFEES